MRRVDLHLKLSSAWHELQPNGKSRRTSTTLFQVAVAGIRDDPSDELSSKLRKSTA